MLTKLYASSRNHLERRHYSLRSVHVVVRPDIEQDNGLFCGGLTIPEFEDDPQVVTRAARSVSLELSLQFMGRQRGLERIVLQGFERAFNLLEQVQMAGK